MSMEFHNQNGISGQMKILERKTGLQVPTIFSIAYRASISNRLNCTGCSFFSFSFSWRIFSSSAILSGPSHLSAWRRSVLYSFRLSYPLSNSFFSRRLTADSRDCRRLSRLFSELIRIFICHHAAAITQNDLSYLSTCRTIADRIG